jgi:hypothetical protein
MSCGFAEVTTQSFVLARACGRGSVQDGYFLPFHREAEEEEWTLNDLSG